MLSYLPLGAIALISSWISPAQAVPTPDDLVTRINNLPDQHILWIGSKERGGPNYTFSGHFMDVTDSIKKLNPYWMREKLFEKPANLKLGKRDPITNVECNNGPAQGSSSAFEAGWQYINSHYGDGNCAAGPGKCGRFACSYNSATLMCNDHSVNAIIPCHTLANEAQGIWGACSRNGEYGSMEGQQFYNKPYQNTLLQHTDAGNGC